MAANDLLSQDLSAALAAEYEAELSKLRQELTEAWQAAAQATRAKEEFLANISHEIRTPMNAIMGYADLLLDTRQTPMERNDCVHAIRRSGHHLITILSDILDISRIEAGNMTLQTSPCKVAHLMEEVASIMRARALENHLTFQIEYASPVSPVIHTDPKRLRQVLLNLVSNAIKFTRTGGVRIVLRLIESSRSSPEQLQIQVIDSGIGMDPDQLRNLFHLFTQLDASASRRFGGTGLGLAISRRLAEMLGGALAVESALGHGSTFTLTIPTGCPDSPVTPRQSPDDVALPNSLTDQIQLGGRILLAEDGPDNQRLISLHLRKAGAEVTVAENGRIALELALQAVADGKPFDLILMDIQMPELDGYSATTRLRQEGYRHPIVALTAHAMDGDREKCLHCGCDNYLTKPIERQHLLASVARYLPAAAASLTTDGYRSDFAADPDLKEILAEFVTALPDQVSALAGLLRQNNLQILRRSLHQIKGTAGGYGFPYLTDLAARAEHAIKSAAPEDEVQQRVNELIALIRRVEGYDPAREK